MITPGFSRCPDTLARNREALFDRSKIVPPQELLEAVRRRPFVPFRLYVSEGATYDIRHPENLLVGLASVTIAVRDDPASYYHHVEIVAARHIIRLVPLEQPIVTGGNGEK